MSRSDRQSWESVPDLDAFAAEVEATCRRLAPLLPDMDPQDLVSIVQSLLRPFPSGRHFLLRTLDRRHVL